MTIRIAATLTRAALQFYVQGAVDYGRECLDSAGEAGGNHPRRNNIADVYPSENIPANNNSGIFPYNGISPFGFNGRFLYARARWER